MTKKSSAGKGSRTKQFLPPQKRADGSNWPADAPLRRKVADLAPYAQNSRTHSVQQIAQIAASIQEWGFTNPVLIDETGMIIAGHGRVMAAQNLGLEEVPCIVASGWSDEQKQAYVIADNQLALNAGWDTGVLASELQALDAAGFDLKLIGLDDDHLAKLLPEPERLFSGDEDDAPEVGEVPISAPGDVWVLGAHRVMCGDSTSVDAVATLMDGGKADMVFTDPPYNVAYSGCGDNNLGTIKNDDMSDASFDLFLDEVFNCCVVAMRDLACIYVCHPDSQTAPKMSFERSFGERFKKSSTLIWAKQSAGMGWQDYRAQHEPILYGWKEGKGSHYYCGDRAKTTVWQIGRDSQASYVHPTQKPVQLPEEAIKNSSRSGDTVLDLFGGSGSTLIACEKTGRTARLMELDPKYVDVIVKRWQTFTGKQATLEDGRTFAEVSHGR